MISRQYTVHTHRHKPQLKHRYIFLPLRHMRATACWHASVLQSVECFTKSYQWLAPLLAAKSYNRTCTAITGHDDVTDATCVCRTRPKMQTSKRKQTTRILKNILLEWIINDAICTYQHMQIWYLYHMTSSTMIDFTLITQVWMYIAQHHNDHS